MILDSLRRRGTAVAFLLLAAGCGRVEEELTEIFRGETPRESYEHALVSAGLEHTALVAEWRGEAERALREAAPLDAPFAEEGWLPPEAGGAVGIRVPVRRGQTMEVRASLRPDSTALLFLDVFRVEEDGTATRVASADSAARALSYEPWRDGDYIVRLQPELLRGGRYTLEVVTDAALAFPVEGHDADAIWSVWGDPRDGGMRSHHGVDIFAPRGTPALAAAAGTVNRVQETPRGGKVVWLRDARRSANLYYAHLDSQTVVSGQQVEVGDTLGFIGNTGNARTTPPHLHFGVYSRGPTDPAPFIRRRSRTPPPLRADTALLGGWARTAAAAVTVRAGPSAGSEEVAVLPRHVPLRVMGAAASWYRVRLTDGRSGYVPAGTSEPVVTPLRRQRVAGATTLLHAPGADGVPRGEVAEGTELEVLGELGGYALVRSPGDVLGWVATPSEDDA